MQFRTLEATAVDIIIAVFAKVMKMTDANQAKAGFSVSPKGNRTIQQASSPKGAIDGKSGQAIPEGTLVNLWQSGRDSNDVRAYVVKAKTAKTPKVTVETPQQIAIRLLEANSAAQDAKLDAILAALAAK